MLSRLLKICSNWWLCPKEYFLPFFLLILSVGRSNWLAVSCRFWLTSRILSWRQECFFFFVLMGFNWLFVLLFLDISWCLSNPIHSNFDLIVLLVKRFYLTERHLMELFWTSALCINTVCCFMHLWQCFLVLWIWLGCRLY